MSLQDYEATEGVYFEEVKSIYYQTIVSNTIFLTHYPVKLWKKPSKWLALFLEADKALDYIL